MPQIIKDAAAFRTDQAWGARDLAAIDGATIRLHWSDQPYHWHRNDGCEVFVVLQGEVDMHYRVQGTELCQRLSPCDIFIAEEGDEHVAHPIGEARILVIERAGSI